MFDSQGISYFSPLFFDAGSFTATSATESLYINCIGKKQNKTKKPHHNEMITFVTVTQTTAIEQEKLLV